jgi:predicted DCC family thiol-disulfide oxidoreductase YuxK
MGPDFAVNTSKTPIANKIAHGACQFNKSGMPATGFFLANGFCLLIHIVHTNMNYMNKSKHESDFKNGIKLKVYYDGLCRLCSYEINHYRSLPDSSAIEFVDITSEHFHAETEGLDPVQAHKYLHVKTDDGRIYTGVDSFKEIWKLIPRYNSWVKYCDNKFLRPILNVGYHVFATHIRPYFQRKTKSCNESPYCELSPSSEVHAEQRPQ